MIFAEPRFATAIIDERDLAGLADAQRRTRPRRDAPAGAPPRHQHAVPGGLLPVGSHQARPVARRRSASSQRFAPQVRVLNYSGSGIETTFTQGEDACLASLVPDLPALPDDGARVAAGGRRAGRRGRRPVHAAVRADRHRPRAPSCRARRSDAMPAVGPNTRYPAGPALPGRHGARAGSARRATPRRALPARRRRHDRLAARPPRRPSASTQPSSHRPPPARAPAPQARWRANARRSPASASSSSPIRSSKCRWRASCRANWACA